MQRFLNMLDFREKFAHGFKDFDKYAALKRRLTLLGVDVIDSKSLQNVLSADLGNAYPTGTLKGHVNVALREERQREFPPDPMEGMKITRRHNELPGLAAENLEKLQNLN